MSFIHEEWDLNTDEDRLEFVRYYTAQENFSDDSPLAPIRAVDFRSTIELAEPEQNIAAETMKFLGFCMTHDIPSIRQFAVDLAVDAIRPTSPNYASFVCFEALTGDDKAARDQAGKRIYEMMGGKTEGVRVSKIDPDKLIEIVQGYKPSANGDSSETSRR
jgi:hypothetical protein